MALCARCGWLWIVSSRLKTSSPGSHWFRRDRQAINAGTPANDVPTLRPPEIVDERDRGSMKGNHWHGSMVRARAPFRVKPSRDHPHRTISSSSGRFAHTSIAVEIGPRNKSPNVGQASGFRQRSGRRKLGAEPVFRYRSWPLALCNSPVYQ